MRDMKLRDIYHVRFFSTDCVVILLCFFIFVSHCC